MADYRTFGWLVAGLLFSLTATAQQLTGHVVAAGTGQAVPFATIGVPGRPLGTTADETGRFVLTIPATVAPTDSVIISCVGYRPARLTVAAARAPGAAYALQPAAHVLREVQVRHGQLRPAVLGGRVERGTAHWNTVTRDVATVADDERGWEVATVLPVRRSCYLDGFQLYLEQNEFRRVRLRFTLYAVQDGQPTRSLLTDDIQFVISDGQTGWVDVDLRPYGLHLAKGQTVAAGVQWLQGEKQTAASRRFGGPGAFPSVGHRVVVRDKSEAHWRSFPANVGMYLDVQEYN